MNTDLSYFDNIIPCGIEDKQVTSMEKELGQRVDIDRIKESLKTHFEDLFDMQLQVASDQLTAVK